MLGLNETTDQLAMTVFIGMAICWGERMIMSSEWHSTLRLKVKGRKRGQTGHVRSRWRKEVWRLVREGKMNFAHQGGLSVLIGWPLGWGESDHPRLLGILPDFRHWSFPTMHAYHCLTAVNMSTCLSTHVYHCLTAVNMSTCLSTHAYHCLTAVNMSTCLSTHFIPLYLIHLFLDKSLLLSIETRKQHL